MLFGKGRHPLAEKLTSRIHVHHYLIGFNMFRYLEKVLEYLSNFLDRVHPLLDQNALYEEIEREFEEKWLQGNFPGWRVS